MYAGVTGVSGEEPIMAVMAKGHSLYMSMDVYGNFMSHGSGVYTSTSGGKKGGHAMAGVGYGTEGGTKYWLLQNSWGSGGWGVDGYGKVLRGRDLAGIEKNAFWVKAWVSGGKKPACSDGQSTGLSAGGQDITCQEAKGGRYGNLCDHGQYGHYVKASCPVTCNSCLEIGTDNGGTPAPGPGPSPPGPAPPVQRPPVQLPQHHRLQDLFPQSYAKTNGTLELDQLDDEDQVLERGTTGSSAATAPPSSKPCPHSPAVSSPCTTVLRSPAVRHTTEDPDLSRSTPLPGSSSGEGGSPELSYGDHITKLRTFIQ